MASMRVICLFALLVTVNCFNYPDSDYHHHPQPGPYGHGTGVPQEDALIPTAVIDAGQLVANAGGNLGVNGRPANLGALVHDVVENAGELIRNALDDLHLNQKN